MSEVDGRKLVVVSFKCSAEFLEKMDGLAEELGVNRSELIRLAVQVFKEK